jgi:hypothetical protein
LLAPVIQVRDDAAMRIVLAGLVPAAVLLMASVLVACGQNDTPLAERCTRDSLKTLYAGVLTVGTDQPVYPPWYMGDNPANGEGFEAAVAYAVAGQLGYPRDAVRWVRVPFNAVLNPGPKSFDINLSEFSITEQRQAAVDFSSPYFDVTQAVVTVKTSPAADRVRLRGGVARRRHRRSVAERVWGPRAVRHRARQEQQTDPVRLVGGRRVASRRHPDPTAAAMARRRREGAGAVLACGSRCQGRARFTSLRPGLRVDAGWSDRAWRRRQHSVLGEAVGVRAMLDGGYGAGWLGRRLSGPACGEQPRRDHDGRWGRSAH